MKKVHMLFVLLFSFIYSFAQQVLNDKLSPAFHKERREALRKLMPPNSVAVIFAAPVKNYANDVDYVYHQNPDMYYFSGYNEPNSVLFIFKEDRSDSAGKYNELFFVQKRNAAAEQWTGKRLGIEGVKQMGFERVYNGESLRSAQLNLSGYNQILTDYLPEGMIDNINDNADLFDLTTQFRKAAAVSSNYNAAVERDLMRFAQNADFKRLSFFVNNLKRRMTTNEDYAANKMINTVVALKDSVEFEKVKTDIKNNRINFAAYNTAVNSLREIKTPEEMTILKRAIDISCLGHLESMKAVNPQMSERKIQGIQELVHKYYGAESVGYPSIVGAGENGCVLHYITNDKPAIGNDLVLIDIGTEYHGYSADITRTFPANGKFTKEQKAIYDLVYKAQEEVFKLCVEGNPFQSLNEKSKEVLAKGLIELGIISDAKELGQYSPHGCSHYLGLDVHDRSNYGTLKENMVVTVEPGIYIPTGSKCDKKWWGIAVRIEDDVRIGRTQYDLLSTAAPRKAEDVEKAVSQKSAFDQLKLPALR
jgi:Xaa-Pro aminopeptidase